MRKKGFAQFFKAILVTGLLFASADAFSQSKSSKSIEVAISNTASHYALVGVTSNWTETQSLYCSRFVRQVFQKAFPKNAYELDMKYFGASAYETEAMWKAQGRLRSYAYVAARGGLRAGDVVFQDWSAYGHVGVVVSVDGKLMVAENTVRYGYYLSNGSKRTDFRALTTLAKFGRVKSVGRISGFSSID